MLIFILIGVIVAFGIYAFTQPVGGGGYGTTFLFGNATIRAIVIVLTFLLAFAIIIFVCCYRQRISLASKIVEVSAVFVAKNCYLVLVPLVMFAITIILVTA